MQKYFPIVASFMVFAGFLAVQVALNIVNTSAKQSDKSGVEKAHYENIFKKQIFVDVKGNRISLVEAKSPIVVINFWASWCAPCLVELPSLVKINQKYGTEKILVLGVNTDEIQQVAKIRKLTDKYKITFPIIPDLKGAILENFMVYKIPTTLIFHKGKLVRHIEGTEDFVSGEMMEFYDDLLTEQGLDVSQ